MALGTAGVLARITAATPLAFAVVFPGAGVGIDRGTGTLAGAGVGALAFSIAGVQTAADVGLLQQEGGID
jgi:hypothetical protein